MKNTEKTHTLAAKIGPHKAVALIVEDRRREGAYWWAVKGSHTVFHSEGKPFRSGTQVNNVESDEESFTYYGNGSAERPDCVADIETLKWLLRDKNQKTEES